MSQKTYSVRVLPSPGGGMPYEETVTCINPPQAQAIVRSRIPDGWRMCYPKEVK